MLGWLTSRLGGELMGEYIPQETEEAWQKKWEKSGIFNVEYRKGNPVFYCLEMYPYPSGKMHMGHVRNYSIGDAVARYKRLMGFDVLYPICLLYTSPSPRD